MFQYHTNKHLTQCIIQAGDRSCSRKTVDDGYPEIDGIGDANTKIKVDRNKQMMYADTMAGLVEVI